MRGSGREPHKSTPFSSETYRIHPCTRRTFLPEIGVKSWGHLAHGVEISLVLIALEKLKASVIFWGASGTWMRPTHGWIRYFRSLR